jgi:transcriptional regulator with XRE-family HTH domain
MSDISDALRCELRDPEYSEGYAESFLNSYIATQIKVIREQREMKQSDLAKAMNTSQTVVSRIENVNYSAWNIKTLKRVARAFRVRLRVSFETYGTLPDEVSKFDRGSLQRTEREKDPGLLERKKPRGQALDEQRLAVNDLNPRRTADEHDWGNTLPVDQGLSDLAQKGKGQNEPQSDRAF